MDETHFPTPDDALSDLSMPLPILYGALEHGAQVARDSFEFWGTHPDPHLFAGIVRHHAKPQIDAGCRDVAGYGREDLSNDGILVRFGRYTIRCLKSENGVLPESNLTVRRVEFYRQLPLGLVLTRNRGRLGAEVDARLLPVNLVLAWDFDPATQLVSVWLVCPRPGSSGSGSFGVAWCEPISHPAETILPASAPAEEPEEIDDLPITPARRRMTGTDEP